MLIGEVPTRKLRDQLSGAGVGLDFGVARARVRSDAPMLAESIRTVYAAFPVCDPEGFYDVSARLARPPGVRRYFRPQVSFWLDGEEPFEPFPADTHLPLLEWGLNWAIASRLNTHLLLHAGVVERDGLAVLLPAMPGSGKSTLTAALANRGFRLLSDEFGVVRLSDAALLPLLRPTALKNESIEVIRRFAPHAVLGAMILFPNFTPGAAIGFEPIPKSRAFTKLSTNSFNYDLLGPDAFDAVTKLVAACECFRLRFSDLEETAARIAALVAERAAAE